MTEPRKQADRSAATRAALIAAATRTVRRARILGRRHWRAGQGGRGDPRRALSPVRRQAGAVRGGLRECRAGTDRAHRRSASQKPIPADPLGALADGAEVLIDAVLEPDVPADRGSRRTGRARLGGVARDQRALRPRTDRRGNHRCDRGGLDARAAGRLPSPTCCSARSTKGRCTWRWPRTPTRPAARRYCGAPDALQACGPSRPAGRQGRTQWRPEDERDRPQSVDSAEGGGPLLSFTGLVSHEYDHNAAGGQFHDGGRASAGRRRHRRKIK